MSAKLLEGWFSEGYIVVIDFYDRGMMEGSNQLVFTFSFFFIPNKQSFLRICRIFYFMYFIASVQILQDVCRKAGLYRVCLAVSFNVLTIHTNQRYRPSDPNLRLSRSVFLKS